MSKKNFTATESQKKEVFKRLQTGELAQGVRLDILNPETQKPIDLDTFCREFADAIKDARAKRGSVVSSNLYAAAIYAGVNKQTGREERDTKAMQQWLALEGRGLFGKKLELDNTDPLHIQLAKIKQACADGHIGTQEMTAFADILFKEMQLVEFSAIKEEFAEIKKMQGAARK